MRLPFGTMSIKAKAALVTTGAVLVLFASFATLEIHRLRAEMRSALGQQQLALISLIADELDDKIRHTQHALVTTAKDTPRGACDDVPAMEAWIGRQSAVHSLFDDVFMIGTNGRVLVDRPVLKRRGIDVRDRNYFRQTLEKRTPQISEPYIGRGRPEPTIMMTAPVLDANGDVMCILAGAVHPFDLNFLGRLREARVGRTGRFALYSLDRTVIVSQFAERVMTKGPEPGASGFFDHLMAANEGWEEAPDLGGIRAVHSYRPLASVPWMLVASLPVEEAYGPIAAAQTEAIVLAVLLALLIAPLVWFGMQRVLAPVGVLRDTIRKIRLEPAGDAVVRMPPGDELGDLAEDFNAMVRERRDASDALAASEERYRSLTELSSDWYWEQDAELRFVSTSGRGTGRGGIAVEEHPHRRRWELPGTDIVGQTWEEHKADLAARKPFRDLLLRRTGAGGSTHYVTVSGEPVFDRTGAFTGYRGVARDITGLKRVEEELLANQRLLEQVIDAIPMSIFAKDLGSNYVMVNRSMAEFFATPKESLLRRHTSELPSQAATREQSLRDDRWVYEHRRTLVHETSIQRPDGTAVPFHSSKIPLFDAKGALTGLLGINRDITEQRLAQEELRASGERFAAMFHDSPAPLAVVDPDGRRFLEINRAFTDLFGYTRGQVVGRTSLEFGAACPTDERSQMYDLLARDGYVDRLELTSHTADGRLNISLCSGRVIEAGGRRTVLFSFADITKLNEAHRRIGEINATLEDRVRERTVQLEAANRELEAFSYSVSHDLKAPLRSIDGAVGILRMKFGAQLPPGVDPYLERVSRRAHEMAELIEGLLDFARLSRQVLNREAVRPEEVVRRVLEDCEDAIRERHAVIQVDDLPACYADPLLLRQVYENLVSNALKYSAQSQPPTIGIGATDEAGTTVYYVRDNGVGFDMAYVDKLFGVFQRLHAPEQFEGTGIGLALVSRIIDRHGGRVWAESAPGKGAAFFFTIGRRDGDHAREAGS
jgi:PAS domain S-box-containing protein